MWQFAKTAPSTTALPVSMFPPMIHTRTAVTCHRLGAPLATQTFLNDAILQQLPTLCV